MVRRFSRIGLKISPGDVDLMTIDKRYSAISTNLSCLLRCEQNFIHDRGTPMKRPRLRTADKTHPPYPLGQFPKKFVQNVGKQIIYDRTFFGPKFDISGERWEKLFASAIGADHTPSNVGLDDVQLGAFAWGAKTVKNSNPCKVQKVRLISGRNSPQYSFDEKNLDAPANELGTMVLEIWNERVSSVKNQFAQVRTVVLVKQIQKLQFSVFEFETIRYDSTQYAWTKNKRGNLEGRRKDCNEHCFTWQPHGSQFTIIENIPPNRVCFELKSPPTLDSETVLAGIGFDSSWITILR